MRKYIARATLHNYRGWVHEVIYFTPGLNVIQGAGDAGKSALEKALRWVTTNETQGNFIYKRIKTPKGDIKGKEEVYVEIEYSTGEIVRRVANKKTPNIYYLYDTSTDFSTLEPFLNVKEIPPEIQAVVNMSPINVQKQYDAFFLLSLSGSDVARELNKMVNLEIIDTSNKHINSIVSRLKKSGEALGKDIASMGEELDSYDYLDTMLIGIEELEQLKTEVRSKRDAISEISEHVSTLTGITLDSTVAKKIASFRTLCEATILLHDEMDTLLIYIDAVSTMATAMREIEDKSPPLKIMCGMKPLAEEVVNLSLEVQDMNSTYTKIENLYLEAIDTQDTDVVSLQQIIGFKAVADEIVILREDLAVGDTSYVEVEEKCDEWHMLSNQLDVLRDDVSELGVSVKGLCPTCGRPLEVCDETSGD